MENTYLNDLYQKLEFDHILKQIVDYSLSEKGKETLFNLKPLLEIELVKKQHQLVQHLDLFLREQESLKLERFINFSRELVIINKQTWLEPSLLYEICFSIKQYFYLKKRFTQAKFTELSRLFQVETLQSPFYEKILKMIRPDGYVENKASKGLAEIRKKIDAVNQSIKKETDFFFRNAKNSGYTADDLISVRDGFTCVAIKSNFKNRVAGIVIDTSGSGQTVFVVSNQVIQLHNQLAVLYEDEKKEIKKIIQEYCLYLLENEAALQIIDHELICFDILYSITQYSMKNDYQSPEIIDYRYLSLIDGKHPLIGRDAVPLNLKIGHDYTSLIITGPNTGGKTVVLKTIGLFILMVQCGIPIPASSSSQFCIFDQLFIDIGDEQSIEQSLSTFSGHIKNIQYILTHLSTASLVLLDELGGGTDPVEGAALAIGMIKQIKRVGALSIITTHYSTIKNFAASEEQIENCSMEFDHQHLKPTYRLLIGIPGSSKAIEISKRLGLEQKIIDEARRYLDEDYINAEKMISLLEEEKIKIEQIKQELGDRENELIEQQAQLRAKLGAVNQQEKKLKQIMQHQQFDFLTQARSDFENLVKKIKSEKASKTVIKEGKQFFTQIESQLLEEEQSSQQEIKPQDNPGIGVGDTVCLNSKNMQGIVIEQANNKDEFVVQFGIVKLNCHIGEMTKVISQKRVQIDEEITKANSFISSEKKLKLDLRGCRFDEAESKVDHFVHQAVVNKLGEIKIIHGKGTGVIRKFVQDYLRSSPFIKDYSFEKINEYQTNYGVTIAHLK